MPEGRSILPYSLDRIDVVLVQNASVIGGINVTFCDRHCEIVEVPANGDSTFVEPLACAVAKVEKSVDRDYVCIASIIP